jgi:hypothetical protein
VIWVFKTDVAGRPTIPNDLLPGALLVIAGLTLDLFHYVAGSLVWGIYNRVTEQRIKEDTEFAAPRQINWPTLFFFWSKTVVMVIAYLLILRFLYRRLM